MLQRMIARDVGPARADWRPSRLTREAAPVTARRVELDHHRLVDNGIFGFEHLDERARPFKLLRSMLLTRLEAMGGQIIAVTSTQPHNGKSFVAANLAVALSHIHPVRLIDLDLRRPTIGARFGLPECAGADDFLLEQRPLSEVGCFVIGHNLGILPVRRPLDYSSDLLASARGAELIAQLRRLPGAPICIIDTPPILEGDEAVIVARRVDGVVLVVEEGQTKQREVREALRMLKPTPLIGTVLNKSNSSPLSPSNGRGASERRPVTLALEDRSGSGR